MNVKTAKDTTWARQREMLVIPAHTSCFVLTKDYIDQIEDEDQRFLLKRLKKMYKDREIDGVFVYLMGQYRWMQKKDLYVV